MQTSDHISDRIEQAILIEQEALESVVLLAQHRLGFAARDICLFAWSGLGAMTAIWAASHLYRESSICVGLVSPYEKCNGGFNDLFSSSLAQSLQEPT